MLDVLTYRPSACSCSLTTSIQNTRSSPGVLSCCPWLPPLLRSPAASWTKTPDDVTSSCSPLTCPAVSTRPATTQCCSQVGSRWFLIITASAVKKNQTKLNRIWKTKKKVYFLFPSFPAFFQLLSDQTSAFQQTHSTVN